MPETRGYAAFDPKSPLRPFSFTRREPGPRDVEIDTLYCGICHSDLHQVRDEWGGSRYPMVPGHEIVGRATRVGAEVEKVQEGDIVGVGCMVDSCRTCSPCEEGLEQYCLEGFVPTYNGTERDQKTPTQGGYSTRIVTDERFVLRVRESARLEAVAPLLCAGITTYSPLRRWNVGKGSRVGVVGLGGLGHMAVKLAAAMGAEVTLFSSSDRKRKDAARLGAHDYVVSSDSAAMAAQGGRLDLVLDTVSADHDLVPLLNALRLDGTLVLVGAPEKPASLPAFSLIMRRRAVAGSLIGGIPETQEMLDFCAERGITADVEVIAAPEIDRAYERMLRGDVRYRFVIDAKSFAAP